MKVLVELDGGLPEHTLKMVRTSIGTTLGVQSSEVIPDVSNESYLNTESVQMQLVDEFSRMVEERGTDVDPARDQDWRTIAIGFAMAKGLTPECAWHFGNLTHNHRDIEFPKPFWGEDDKLSFHPRGKYIAVQNLHGEETVYKLSEEWDIETIDPEPVMPENIPVNEYEIDSFPTYMWKHSPIAIVWKWIAKRLGIK